MIAARKVRVRFQRHYLWIVVAALLMLFAATTVFAATPTPVPPTATYVPLMIPINDVFTQANVWMQTLSPVESLSIGILVALAVFGFLYKAIKSAFG